MAKQLINLGTPNGRDGDTVRVAFGKINENFSDLYVGLDLLNIATNVRPAASGLYDLGSVDRVWHALWLDTEGVHIGEKLLSVNTQGAITVDGDVVATPNGDPVQADWSAASGPSQILNKPALSAVATSNDYRQLSHKPTIPTQTSQLDNDAGYTTFSGSWTDLTNKPALFNGSYLSLTNRPSLFSGSYLDLVHRPTLFTGSYLDLTNKPAIPLDVNQLTDVDSLLGAGGGGGSNLPTNAAGVLVNNGSGTLSWSTSYVTGTPWRNEGYLASDGTGLIYGSRLVFVNGNGSDLSFQTGQTGWGKVTANNSEGFGLKSDLDVAIRASDKHWTFGTNGSLTFPNGSTIADKTGTLSQGPAVDTQNISDTIGVFHGLNFAAPNGVAVGWTVNGPGVNNVSIFGLDVVNGFVQIDSGVFQVGESYTFTGPSAGTAGVGITVNNKDWTFGTDGKLTLPGTQTISDDAGDLVITNPVLRAGVSIGVHNPSETPTHWYFASNGQFNFPSGAGFARGDNGQLKTNDGATQSLDFRDATGRGFYTNGDGFSLRSNGSNTWKFDVDGNLTVPGNILMSNIGGIYSTTAGYTVGLRMSNTEPSVKLVAHNHEWQFNSNGVLKFPIAYSSEPTITMAESANLLIQGYKASGFSENGGNVIVSGGSAGDGGNNGNANIFGQQVTVQTQLSTDLGSPTYSWTFDVDGKLTFPNASTFDGVDFVAKTDNELNLTIPDSSAYIGVKQSNNLNEPAAYMDVYFGKKSRIRTTSLDNQTAHDWYFNPDGSLTVPGDIKSTAGVGPVVIEANNGTLRTWTFGGDGSLTLPNSTAIADATETITYNAINSLNYESGKIGTFATLNIDATDPTSVGGGWIVNGPGVTDGVVNGIDTLVQTVSINTSTGNAFIDGESYTFTSPTLFSVGSKLTVNGKDWKFKNDGSLTLPTGGTVSYTPATSTDWSGTPPATMQEAIDRLAAAFKTLNNGTGA